MLCRRKLKLDVLDPYIYSNKSTYFQWWKNVAVSYEFVVRRCAIASMH